MPACSLPCCNVRVHKAGGPKRAQHTQQQGRLQELHATARPEEHRMLVACPNSHSRPSSRADRMQQTAPAGTARCAAHPGRACLRHVLQKPQQTQHCSTAHTCRYCTLRCTSRKSVYAFDTSSTSTAAAFRFCATRLAAPISWMAYLLGGREDEASSA